MSISLALGLTVFVGLAACQPAAAPPLTSTPSDPVWAPPPAPADPLIAQVAGRSISVARLRARLPTAAGQSDVSLDSALQEEINYALLLQAAYDRGLQRDPEVVEHAQRVMVRRLLQAELSSYSDGDDRDVDETALRAAYEAHRQRYMRPSRRLLAGVQWGRSETDRQRAQALLAALPVPVPDGFLKSWRAGAAGAHALAGADDKTWWDALALADKLGKEVAAAIWATPVGKVVPQVLSCPAGWCVVHVRDEHTGRAREFDEVREEVREKLEHGQRGEQFERFLAELRAIYPVAIDTNAQQGLQKTWPAAR